MNAAAAPARRDRHGHLAQERFGFSFVYGQSGTRRRRASGAIGAKFSQYPKPMGEVDTMAEASTVLDVRPSLEKVGTGLKQSARHEIATDLSEILADSYLLVIKSHVYHWNVVGPLFRSIHVMTEGHYEEIFKACDVLAERIRALGFPAPITKNGVLADGKIAITADALTAHEMVDDLVADHEALCRKMRKAAERADAAQDFVTTDLLTERLAYHEKVAWMLRAVIAE